MFTFPNILWVFIYILQNNGKGKESVSFTSQHMKLSVVPCRNLESYFQSITRHFVIVLCFTITLPFLCDHVCHLVLVLLFAEHPVSFPKGWSLLDTRGLSVLCSLSIGGFSLCVIVRYVPVVTLSCGIVGLGLLKDAEWLTLCSWYKYGHLLLMTMRSYLLPLFLFSRNYTFFMIYCGVWICIC